jgi:3-oxoacid CoA-transferase subunit B/acetate CoA/acetoacetate CoA-transferase beta subunit
LGNAGGEPVTMLTGSAAFDLSASFCVIRGGHLDATVLGALQVDEEGLIANWKIPGIRAVGMGGGMDLLAGAKKVIIAMEHQDKKGNSKIVKKCNLPLSSIRKIDLIITDKAVIEVTDEGLLVKEIASGLTPQELENITEAKLIFADNIKEIAV